MEVRLQQHMRFAEDRPVSEILHSCQDMRVVLYNLLPGQQIDPHTSSSSVCLQIIDGAGDLLCGAEWVTAAGGTVRFYPPGEVHGVRAGAERMSVLAMYTPRP